MLAFVADDGQGIMVRKVYKDVDIAERCAKIEKDGGPKFTKYFYVDELSKAVIPDDN